MQGFTTVSREADVELIINKSRFIGRCFPVSTEEAALSRLEEIKKRHRDATHNCYAYSIGPMGGAARFSDDGEPGGTAGLPMMEAIKSKGVTDLIVVVTRYFGGVLLGAGGLVRAYSKAASSAIEAAGPVLMRPAIRYGIMMDYGRWSALEPWLRQAGEVTGVDYTDTVSVSVIIPEENGDAFVRAVVERTDGKLAPVAEERCFARFPVDGANDGGE